VAIGPACSGFEGIGLIWAFLAAYLILFRRELRFPHAVLLLPIGTAVIWTTNVLRIALLVLVGASGRSQVALGGFHSQAGWLAFNLVGLGIVALSQRIRWFSRIEGSATTQPAFVANPTAAYLLPLMAVVAVSMITKAMTDSAFDRFYGARILAGLFALWIYRRHNFKWEWSWSTPAIGAGILVFLLWTALEPAGQGAPKDTDKIIPSALYCLPAVEAKAWLASRVLGSVTIIPLVEELAFRGYLLRRLIAADFEEVAPTRFTWPSFIVSSLLFGVMHERWLAGTLAGMIYALVVLHRGRLCHAVLAHATTNALIAVSVLSMGYWSLWT
jgi:exosortase E/protease (VPEID-CTERM system)